MKKVNLTGMTTKYLEVMERGPDRVNPGGSKQLQWLCKCVCGNQVLMLSMRLLGKFNNNISCGCKNFTGEHKNRTSKDPRSVSFNALIKSYKFRAKNSKTKQISWNLQSDQAISLFMSNCYYCGVAPNRIYNAYITKSGKSITKALDWCKSAEIVVNGIDRINSELNYETNNVVSCCTVCNYAKSTMTTEEFYSWLDRIAIYQGYRKCV